MKRRLMHPISCLLVVFLLLFGAIPCQAMTHIKPQQAASMAELLTWYSGLSGLSGTAPQECGVTQPVVCKGKISLAETSCRVDIVILRGLSISSGAWLTIDNPNLVVMGAPPAITVEAGGVLCVKRLHPLVAQAMPQGGIVVQAGGVLLLEDESTFADGVVVDQNVPPNTMLPPVTTPPPDETAPPAPETPPAEETLVLQGEVLRVAASGTLLAMLTIPRVDSAVTKNIAVERSTDMEVWDTKYNFRWNEEGLDFRSEDDGEFGSMCGRNRSDGSKTDFKYLARLSGEPFYLRVVLTGADGQQSISNAIGLTELPVGQYPGSEDYEDYDGNRGGGGQGTTDREEQKQSEPPSTDSDVAVAPKHSAQAKAATKKEETPAAIAAPEPQTSAPAAQTTAEQQTIVATGEPVRLAQARSSETTVPTEKNAQAVAQTGLEKHKSPNSFARNGLVIVATLALCGGIWRITTKRKKS